MLRVAAAVLLISVSLAMPAWAASQSVAIQSFTFVPPTVTINAGETVSWLNKDPLDHTATSDTGAFDTGAIPPLGGKTITFTTAGTYAYHCTFHPSMKGTVIVVGAAPRTAPPPTPTPRPTPPPTPPPTAAPTAPPTVVPAPSPSPTVTPSAVPSPSPTPRPSDTPIKLPSPVAIGSPASAPAGGPDQSTGPGMLVAAAAVVFAVALAAVAITLYRRR